MNEYVGESGGGSSTPSPTVNFEAVDMDTTSVRSLGDAMVKDADNMRTVAGDIREQLVDPAGERGMDRTFPVGADPRQSTLHEVIVSHSRRMADTHVLLENVSIGVRNIGLVCQRIADQIGDVDALNSASTDQVRGIIGDAMPAKPEDV